MKKQRLTSIKRGYVPYWASNPSLLDEVCRTCGRRFGQHFGHSDRNSSCEYKNPNGPQWSASGVYVKNKKPKDNATYWELLDGVPANPNAAFVTKNSRSE